MKIHSELLRIILLMAFVLAILSGCGDDGSGGGDDTETGSANADGWGDDVDSTGDSPGDSSGTVDTSARDTSAQDTAGRDTSMADTTNNIGSGSCTCMSQTACAAGVATVDYTIVCPNISEVCCRNASGGDGGDTDVTFDTSDVIDTGEADTGWWDDDTASSGVFDCVYDCVGRWECDAAAVVEGQECDGRFEVRCNPDYVDTAEQTWSTDETDPDFNYWDTSACPYDCVDTGECPASLVAPFLCPFDGVCCGNGWDTATDTDSAIYDSGAWDSGAWDSGAWDSDAWDSGAWDSGAWDSDAWDSDAWDSGAWDSGAYDSDYPDSDSLYDCASNGFYCVATTQCTVAQARMDLLCDVAGTVCCDISQ